jgi:hypothetical protein
VVRTVFPELMGEKISGQLYLSLFNKYRHHEYIPALPPAAGTTKETDKTAPTPAKADRSKQLA